MRDRYEHWYEEGDRYRAIARPMMAPSVRDLEDLVLQDLAKAETESEKQEILDSYSKASQRKYRNRLLFVITDLSERMVGKLLGPILQQNLPAPEPPYHPYVAVAVSQEKEESL